MRIIVPMAGMGKRLRPHTLITPKPLFPIAGKPIVQRLVEDIARLYKDPLEEISFVIGNFGPIVEASLYAIGERLNTKVSIYFQEEALGTAHAINCAKASLQGEVIIAFADTLFQADFQLDRSADGVIWVNTVEDPRAFGVVQLDAHGIITDMVEKPDVFVSDLAIIGIYYIKDGARLNREITYLLDNNLRSKGEYQLTDALQRMRQQGARFRAGQVKRWMDCGNAQAVLHTNEVVLAALSAEERAIPPAVTVENCTIVQPCYIAEGAKLSHSVIGPFVSIGRGSSVSHTVIEKSIVLEQAEIHAAVVSGSIIGNLARLNHQPLNINLGDYSEG